MTKNTFESIMASRLNHIAVESTLYIPSSYDCDSDDDDGADQREQRSPSERSEKRARFSRFALQRCLAWSQEDDDQTEDRVQGEEVIDDLVERFSESAVTRDYSESSISMVKSFGSYHSAMVDTASSTDFLTASTVCKNGIRPIHWEEQVTVDKNLNSFLSSKKATTIEKQ
jgi:hypothetical protein